MRRRWIWVSGRGLVPDYEYDGVVARQRSAEVIEDIAPFRSPVSGEMVTSRTALREHNAVHGVVQVGNDRLSDSRSGLRSDSVARELAERIASSPRARREFEALRTGRYV